MAKKKKKKAAPRRQLSVSKAGDPPVRVEREQIGPKIAKELLERTRNAIFYIGRGLSLSALIEEALLAIVEDLEGEYNHGKPFPERGGPLRPGRPPTR